MSVQYLSKDGDMIIFVLLNAKLANSVRLTEKFGPSVSYMKRKLLISVARKTLLWLANNICKTELTKTNQSLRMQSKNSSAL